MSAPLVRDDSRIPDDACELRYQERLRARRWYQRALDRIVRAKRVYQGAVLGYVVFDPTVAGILLPFFLSLIPIIAIQIWWSHRWNQARRGVEFYRRSLERRRGDWSGRGDAGDRYRDPDHLYSEDLDLFGPGSLFQWLWAPHMSWGCDVLADWLTRPADAMTIRERQDAVRELSQQLDSREAIDAWPHATAVMEREAMRTAATARPIISREWLRWPLAVAAWSWVVCLILAWFRGDWWWQPALVGLVVEAVAYTWWRADIRAICSHGYELGGSLHTVEVFSKIVTGHTWKSELLQRMANDSSAEVKWSRLPAATVRNIVLQLPLAYFLAVQLLPWYERRLHRRLSRFPRALAGIGHWETLAAFGAAAYENPGSSFPIICTDQICLVAEALTHPLLKNKHAVANDIRLDSSQRLLLVSGTNMSGKSTLLRAVGLNAVLALAGGPVLANRLILSPVVVATAMRFQDSLGTGTSYFYAVLQRMRRILEQLSQPQPLLFLLDEILPGTNSHDRLIGAEAVIRRLLAADALGLVTTHDLELTRIAVDLAPSAANMHFTDEVIAGKLHFDYRLRPGVVQSSNALKLMRDMGIDV